MPRPKLRTPELRDRLLTEALDLLAGEGAAGFTARRLASRARTSTPAVYELFGDKAGLIREVFFLGWRLLADRLARVEPSADPRADLTRVARLYREFMLENPRLAEVMLARPFADFDPAAEEAEAGAAVRELIVGHVRRCVHAGLLEGDETDLAHVVVALVQGMSVAENARRLGRSPASVERRWQLGLDALLRGMTPTS
ncbi:TetR/AcrR family transcriptional regulator [Blastococcus goldschmidtiae]|uniref:TetR/AcrR family transcriptional regulator n=1 Tax=Blastococcus goldschmidtiae TaxID=3075546 RepID=A0ABU2K2R6_9ACTN|nr:TetR/AcrR family transcriptional regulator [Blastococcus sp. DSM 46792]MDT0274431.1 TetR/AcrR family transcriptional regulator [Blastococcus sp. DSM 46792]